MKVLVTYFSQSENTEKIAKAIFEEASEQNEAALKKLEEITPEEAADYDFIFIGSPLHSANLAAPVKEWLGVLKASSGQKIAGFITHMSPAYPAQDMQAFTEPIEVACKANDIEYKGCFDCQGYLADAMHGSVQQMLKMDDEQWTGMVKAMTGRPNDEDVANAKEYARAVMA